MRLAAVVLSFLIILLPACTPAYQHWLTDAEDAELRAKCENVPGNCVAVPMPLWMKIKELISGMRGV